MKEINITSFWDKIKDFKSRDCLKEILEYIDGDSPFEGNILCLCGLEGTGKRTLMMQALEACKFKNEECLFLEAEDEDELYKLDSFLEDVSKNHGIKVVFIDEIARTSFIDEADELICMADGYKLRIIVSINSPNILYYTKSNLYRTYKHMHDDDPWNEVKWGEFLKRLSVEDITYAEHYRCFGPTSIEDYAKYGGLMNKDIANTYYNTEQYVENCVAEQILNIPGAMSCGFSPSEYTSHAFGKICELLCGDFEEQEFWNPFSHEFKINTPSYESFGNGLSTKRKVILEPIVKILNASFPNGRGGSPLFVRDVVYELGDMGFLCETENEIFIQSSKNGCWNRRTEYEYHIKQNAIRYQFLKNGSEHFRKDWRVGRKIIETIICEIIQKTVLFDTSKALGYENYGFTKVSFIRKDSNCDGSDFTSRVIDMIVYDRNKNHHWAFSVSFGELKADTETLIDPEFIKVTEDVYGPRVGSYVLHDDNDFISDDGIHFINIERFLLKLDELKNMDDVLEA